MLRAVGMTRRQVRRMIRHESVITALIGAALGLPLGIFLALLVTRALSQYDLQFALPTVSLIAVRAGRDLRGTARGGAPGPPGGAPARPASAAVRVAWHRCARLS